jgi:hypothetical protein
MNVVSRTEEEKKPRVNEKNMLCNKKKRKNREESNQMGTMLL